MESEMKDMNSKPAHSTTALADGSTTDDSPLLKAESTENIEELEKKFAAFVRRDVYGTMGRGELPFTEKVLLGIALVTLVPIRVILAMSVLILYYLICRICTLFSVPNRDKEQEDYAHMGGWRRSAIVWSGRFLSRVILFVLGFYWIKETYRISDTQDESSSSSQSGVNNEVEEPERPGAIISNHVSYLDILYHMSSSFPSFVAKRSVAKLPLVGIISKCLGCVYVQRESKSSDFKGVSDVVTKRVQEAHQDKSAPMMMLFPEGTTTNGDFLLPFKTGAFLAGVPVLPVILRYPYQRFSPAWDSISGVRHVLFLLCQFVNHIEVTRLPVYYPSQQEKDDPKFYAENVRRMMASKGNLIMSDIGLAEKRIYHAALNGLFSPS
ncbi:lysophospholipid acyltransferase LPEAT1-like isoform X2 [Mangifera indica]|uniref:lysophospholipid acyltransferase LPEAT1-like isoform X2 n=1 Tax=Mangifera indica TaxID=29780 RepID=UPI001CF9A991|nr:lysophospholipid acyltransferase LPEAT1-like isoform X2 [Mangifera indica]XP_044511436.1 lysophospholipid acyltransferase LPEAT1-like isoform X2 [Mangifera indica]